MDGSARLYTAAYREPTRFVAVTCVETRAFRPQPSTLGTPHDKLGRMPRSDFRLSHRLRVRWAEVDPQNIVFNPNYLMYFDVAAGEYWRELGFTYPEGMTRLGVDTFAVAANIQFHRSARYDDELDVCARTTRIGRTSLRVALEIYRGDEHLVTGELVYVIADPRTQKPVPIPDALRQAIVQYEPLTPEQQTP